MNARTARRIVQPSPDNIPPVGQRDRWGNLILSAPGWEGQYRIRGWVDGREVRVCGKRLSTEHLPFWEFDARQGYVCRKCWPRRAKGR